MSFLKIASISNTTPEELFTLGVSTSRGQEDKIGQFGSGTLMGVLAWMRTNGESPIFVVNGLRVKFDTEVGHKSDGTTFGKVVMIVGRKRTILPIALEYGELDWKTPELGLREWISNAIDAGAKDCLSVSATAEAAENEVAVFVPYRGVAKVYHANLGKYFLHFSGKASEDVIPKTVLSPCRLYRKGVFVCELKDLSWCDYNLNFDINECRTGSSDNLRDAIRSHNNWSVSTPEHAKLICNAILSGQDCVEANISRLCSLVKAELQKLVGIKKFCTPSFLVSDCEPIAAKFYNMIREEIPELDGLRNHSQALVEGFTLIPPRKTTQQNFDKFCTIIEAVGLANGKDRPSLTCFKTNNGQKPKCLAFYQPSASNGTGMVSIWDENDTSMMHMVHELCHHYSGCADWESGFADFAHSVISGMLELL